MLKNFTSVHLRDPVCLCVWLRAPNAITALAPQTSPNSVQRFKVTFTPLKRVNLISQHEGNATRAVSSAVAPIKVVALLCEGALIATRQKTYQSMHNHYHSGLVATTDKIDKAPPEKQLISTHQRTTVNHKRS